ncbi:hypothetical protein M595_3633 [Lyngbya aestuarii BL J]|uniref:Uncharacterized protein n=1 Tax=Lyngbya aestuarii BL J TaxID=1348334 RepID=U7QEM5_9CYAN|nr:hypothetical protein [Lyngbya aestuarii]ERT06374.1 hypothetical protein M595_3633 [Lyngbya aestuarii BL J]
MSKIADNFNFSVFGAKHKEAILVPEMPIAVRNNCQSGKWTIGDEEYGSKCSITILKFSKFFGSLGQTQNTLWGQIWFIAESGDLPQGVVIVTYIKSRSLNDFNRLVASIQARGVEPATGIFVPEFIKHSGQKPDENGTLKPINYYSLKWTWKERTNWSVIEQAAAVLSSESNLSRMIDLEGTKSMVCLDNLSPHDIAYLITSHSPKNQTEELSLDSSRENALLPASEKVPAKVS